MLILSFNKRTVPSAEDRRAETGVCDDCTRVTTTVFTPKFAHGKPHKLDFLIRHSLHGSKVILGFCCILDISGDSMPNHVQAFELAMERLHEALQMMSGRASGAGRGIARRGSALRRTNDMKHERRITAIITWTATESDIGLIGHTDAHGNTLANQEMKRTSLASSAPAVSSGLVPVIGESVGMVGNKDSAA